jgi:LCP family protein required for cell wall assembly
MLRFRAMNAPFQTRAPVFRAPSPRLARTWLSPVAAFIRGYFTSFFGGLVSFVVLVTFVSFLPGPRTNILLLGLDQRPDQGAFVSRTDTMILMTVNPNDPYVGLLSIPRDLYVTLPNGSVGRINTAHFFAEAEEAGTGPRAAMETVRSNFGLDVHRYVRIDFVGFVRIVDALGGIQIDVPAPLVDSEYPTEDYGVETVSFEAGPQHMNGEQALAYARIRHGSSDFQRAERQQSVIQALISRLLQPGAWIRFPLLVVAVSQAVDTNLGPLDMLRLLPTLLRVGPSGLDRKVIEGNMVQPFTTENGGSVQLPVWENINPVLLEMFGQ